MKLIFYKSRSWFFIYSSLSSRASQSLRWERTSSYYNLSFCPSINNEPRRRSDLIPLQATPIWKHIRKQFLIISPIFLLFLPVEVEVLFLRILFPSLCSSSSSSIHKTNPMNLSPNKNHLRFLSWQWKTNESVGGIKNRKNERNISFSTFFWSFLTLSLCGPL